MLESMSGGKQLDLLQRLAGVDGVECDPTSTHARHETLEIAQYTCELHAANAIGELGIQRVHRYADARKHSRDALRVDDRAAVRDRERYVTRRRHERRQIPEMRMEEGL